MSLNQILTPEYAVWKLGKSTQDRPLDALAIAPRSAEDEVPSTPARPRWRSVLFLGGVHGDEIEGVWLLEELRAKWTQNFPFQHIGAILWAQVNPDGVALGQRWNGRNVDLNRNLPTKDWTPEAKNPRYPPGPSAASEPESKALVRLIESVSPIAIISVHSFSSYQVNSNGPARPWAEALAKICDYPVTEDIGYPTPGSLGTYAGAEKKIPTITLEVERGIPKEKVLSLHMPVLEAAVRYWDDRKTGAVS